jgi:hypothetical protein
MATKGKHINTLKEFYIDKISKKGIQTDEIHTDRTNPIYDILMKYQD